MFYDLNVPWPVNDPKLIPILDHLGYNVIALNYTHNGKIPGAFPKVIPDTPFPQTPKLRTIKRLTLILSDGAPPQTSQLQAASQQYDLLAVRPTSEKTFQQACTNLEGVDMISLDMSERLPYVLKMSTCGAAVSRGLKFEICYSQSIHDLAARRQLISNAAALTRATRSRGIIISSSAARALELRGPYDVINLATMWGLSQEIGRDAVGEGARAVCMHAETRGRTHKAVLRVVDGGAVAATEKRKAEDVKVAATGGDGPAKNKKAKKGNKAAN
ncbi:PHP domain-like protein [Saitoella complicata NRRL Y-17804]|uniref:Uncharacterized protein n=1 Tax=Saitoella complicata (strain BCRC 22490 / CBS 7301 / JCM 7358 / NBRC 10748 / NRRL Y-17804) TaxID=698492 RepID=A0A0E9NID0_SAICN|nr:PHP domain-like protein [Saitoella complicata NRRL Y-17804]ODQ51001.1 PHP domain-like protein [Saitoella complicata NRRL Y-17804]GAO49627.1 hypothetical protein G7K_3776-t1 [Saitoella complicata NRRL Y-17804]